MYAFVVKYWRDADPALQPMVREAHRRALTLEGNDPPSWMQRP
jgi:hypothetical protein